MIPFEWHSNGPCVCLQVVLTQSTNGRGTQAHASRTRKRDILKRAISKFKIGTHEQTAISTEDQG